LFLGFDSRKFEALLAHLRKMEKSVFAVHPELLPVPRAQNMFLQLEILPMQRQPEFPISNSFHNLKNEQLTAFGILEP
jgi:hypothetical protein